MNTQIAAKKPSGSINPLFLILLGIGAVLLVGFVSLRNGLARQENGVVAAHEELKNVHSSIFNQMKSQGLAIEKYGDLVIKAIEVSMTGRYGETGSKAGVQWIKEQNPEIDVKIMDKLQVAIESGYKEFQARQTTKIDLIRVYDNSLDTWPSSWVASIAGFPNKVTADMRKTISSAATDDMMQRKQFDTINPFSTPAEAK
jgi:hypothetical protein